MKKNKTFIIAEAGVNHNGSLKNAINLIKKAKYCGADAVKFQIFDKHEQISEIADTAPYQQKNTKKKKMLEMAKNYDFDWKHHIKLKKICDDLKIEYMASCFDKSSVDFYIKKLKANIIKIASSELDNLRLLKHINKSCNNAILSTGMSSLKEIDIAVKTLKDVKNLGLLQCTSLYPTPIDDVNLNVLNVYKKKYNLTLGFSDHTLDSLAALISIGFGCRIIEKHFTLNKKFKGPDHKISMDPKELKNYIYQIREAEKALGVKVKLPSKSEKKMIKYTRRGIFASEDIKKNQIIRSNNLCYKRPAIYTKIEDENKILGKKAKVFIQKGSALKKGTF